MNPSLLALSLPSRAVQSDRHADTDRSSTAVQSKAPTVIRLLRSRRTSNTDTTQNLFFGFAGIVCAVAAWSIWGGDMFPAQPDPTGEPETWTEDEMKRWLDAVSVFVRYAQIIIILKATAWSPGGLDSDKRRAGGPSEGQYESAACVSDGGNGRIIAQKRSGAAES